ncbi:uncharacterized protein METZ01_LOCUS345163 [marine metagenome]|uniref:Prolyl 4-hydroxylase alpha subunit Fe(2+) 2OG dioxygenase domain-containing protein n=1 Tax=marine metagenome TaxID=408172 RepID=A0A382R3J9_9ZZZZ|tara:strand:- start:134 stop:733 length:600 start_codon:yes stop_codon:yes gene_type:complete
MTVKILDNCCSPDSLDFLKLVATAADNWNLQYPIGIDETTGEEIPFEDKFLKLDIINNGIRNPYLAGLAMGLLIQIHEAGGQDLFIPEIWYCSISIKDKHRPDNIHIDHEASGPNSLANASDNFIKVMGVINSDWEEEWGGSFFHDGTSYYAKPTSFYIFDQLKPHAADEIFTDKKRLAIDFTVFRNQQSLEKVRSGWE